MAMHKKRNAVDLKKKHFKINESSDASKSSSHPSENKLTE